MARISHGLVLIIPKGFLSTRLPPIHHKIPQYAQDYGGDSRRHETAATTRRLLGDYEIVDGELRKAFRDVPQA